jgi:hypothetical protein
MWILKYILTFVIFYVAIRFVIYVFQSYRNNYLQEPFIERMMRPHIRKAKIHFDDNRSYANECYRRWLRKASSYSIF